MEREERNCYIKGSLMAGVSLVLLFTMHAMANPSMSRGQGGSPTYALVSEQDEPCEALAMPLCAIASGISERHVLEPVTEAETEAETEPITEAETEAETVPVIEIQKKYLDIPLSHALQDYVWSTAEHFGVDPILCFAIMEEESLYRSDAVSSTGDYGYFQVNLVCYEYLNKHYGIVNLLDPYENIVAGCALLKWNAQFMETDSTDELLMLYGRGVGRGRNLWDQGIRTLPFIEKIHAIMDRLKGELQ